MFDRLRSLVHRPARPPIGLRADWPAARRRALRPWHRVWCDAVLRLREWGSTLGIHVTFPVHMVIALGALANALVTHSIGGLVVAAPLTLVTAVLFGSTFTTYRGSARVGWWMLGAADRVGERLTAGVRALRSGVGPLLRRTTGLLGAVMPKSLWHVLGAACLAFAGALIPLAPAAWAWALLPVLIGLAGAAAITGVLAVLFGAVLRAHAVRTRHHARTQGPDAAQKARRAARRWWRWSGDWSYAGITTVSGLLSGGLFVRWAGVVVTVVTVFASVAHPTLMTPAFAGLTLAAFVAAWTGQSLLAAARRALPRRLRCSSETLPAAGVLAPAATVVGGAAVATNALPAAHATATKMSNAINGLRWRLLARRAGADPALYEAWRALVAAALTDVEGAGDEATAHARADMWRRTVIEPLVNAAINQPPSAAAASLGEIRWSDRADQVRTRALPLLAAWKALAGDRSAAIAPALLTVWNAPTAAAAVWASPDEALLWLINQLADVRHAPALRALLTTDPARNAAADALRASWSALPDAPPILQVAAPAAESDPIPTDGRVDARPPPLAVPALLALAEHRSDR